MPPTLDPETKELLNEVKTQLGEQSKVKAAVQQLEEQMKGVPATIDNKVKAMRSVAYDGNGRYRGLFDDEDQGRSFGLMAVSKVLGTSWAADALKSEYPDVHKDFTSTDADALIPEGHSNVIIDLIEQYGVFERNAMTYPMGEATVPYPKKTSRTSAVPMGEGTSVAQTKPTMVKKQLTARKWGTYTEVPTEVTEDTVGAIAELMAADMAEGHALAIDEAGFLGDGTATYNQITGVTNALITEAIVTGSGTTWGDLTMLDHEQAVGTCRQSAFVGAGDSGPAWYCSLQYFWNVMVPLTLSVGGVTAAEVGGRRLPVFLGFPVNFTQVLPSATAVDTIGAVFGNLRKGSVFGDRRQLTFKQSEHFKFDEDVLAMLTTRRYDIQVHGAGIGTDPEVLSAVATAAA